MIRKVLTTNDSQQAEAIAVVCRLLNAPACKATSTTTASNPTDDASSMEKAYVYYMDDDDDESESCNSNVANSFGLDLGRSDVLVAASWKVSNNPKTKGMVAWKGSLEACSTDDKNAIYQDVLFGTRGETPTTVIQWSKGTVF